MAFEHRVTARFYEIDRAGIVFFGRFFEYCHAAFEEMLTAMFGDLERALRDGSWAMPVVHAESDFRRPVRMGDRLRIQITVDHLGERSIGFAYDIAGAETGDQHGSTRIVHSFVDTTNFQPTAVPEAFKAALRRIGLLPADDSAAWSCAGRT